MAGGKRELVGAARLCRLSLSFAHSFLFLCLKESLSIWQKVCVRVCVCARARMYIPLREQIPFPALLILGPRGPLTRQLRLQRVNIR